MKKLTKIYKDMEIFPESASFDEFVRGFNISDVIYDYIDAGNGKEYSDEKIKSRSPIIGQYPVSADFVKQISDMIWRTSIVSVFSLAVRQIMGTPVYSGRSSRMRRSVGGSLFSQGPPLPTN
jgi:hypothetical protein